MKALVRNIILIIATAVAVTVVQAYAQDDLSQNAITITCQTGHLIVSEVWDVPIGTTIVLGTNIRGDQTTLENCTGSYSVPPAP